MPLYELISPSDEYYFEARTRLAAAVAAYAIGRGATGAKEVEGDWSTPILFGWGEFLKGLGLENLTPAEAVQNRRDVVAALLSVTIGPRGGFSEAVKLTGENRIWRHDQLRTSMNDLGRTAWKIAEAMALSLGDSPAQSEAPPPQTQPRIEDGRVAWEAYRTAAHGPAHVGLPDLPGWDDMGHTQRERWRAVADALRMWWEQGPLRTAIGDVCDHVLKKGSAEMESR